MVETRSQKQAREIEEILLIEDIVRMTETERFPFRRKIDILTELNADSVKEFQHAFSMVKDGVKRKAYISAAVWEQRVDSGTNVEDETAISNYLDNIVSDNEEGKVRDGIRYMKANLKWPKKGGHILNKISLFIRDVHNLKRYISNYEENKEV